MTPTSTAVPTSDLRRLAAAVDRLDTLTWHHSGVDVDPTQMLEALGDIYRASRYLTHASLRPRAGMPGRGGGSRTRLVDQSPRPSELPRIGQAR